MKIRTLIAAVVAALSSFALMAPPAHAAGSVCYYVYVGVNGEAVVNEAACHDLP